MGLENLLLRLAGGWAKIRSKEPAIIVDDYSITIKYEKPAKNQNGRAWDTSLYNRGNIFVRGKANPVTISDDKDALYPSDKYREYMKMNAIKDAFHSEGRKTNLLLYGLIGLGIMNLVLILLQAVILGG